MYTQSHAVTHNTYNHRLYRLTDDIFREREGSFNPHTQYGAIKLKQFSLVEETSPEDTELRFTSLKFYKPIPGTLKVDFIFVVVCNHEIFLEVLMYI